MCSEVHSSSYLMFCRADRFWHYSQCCGDDSICLCVCRRAYVCVDVYFCVFLCISVCVCLSVDAIKESDGTHFCCLDWSGGLGPHNAMFSLFCLNGLQCQRGRETKVPLCLAIFAFSVWVFLI